jgi:hypothetical protein
MASSNARFSDGGHGHSQPGATCPYCSQTLDSLAPAPDSALASGIRPLGAGADLPTRAAPRSICRRCQFLFEGDAVPAGLSEEDRRRVLIAAYRARRAHDRFLVGHEERFRAVSELAEAFVGLSAAPGVRPFSATTLHNWACEQPLDDAQRAAVAFVLHVADAAARWKLRFEVVAAMKCWDTAQRAVFVEWARRPWWA